MADLTIKAKLAGRLTSTAGGDTSVAAGEDIALIEAMKMEIPLASSANGR
jgi:biotin carboxyl carrier protein